MSLDLFQHAEQAARLRNAGMALAADAQDGKAPEWSALAYAAIVTVARRQETLDGGLEVNVEHERLLQIEDEVERSARTLLGAAAGPDAAEGVQARPEKTRGVRA